MSETPENPTRDATTDQSEHNAYQAEPEKPGDEIGYHAADPNPADEGYTSENVFKRKGEKAPWGRTAEGAKGDHPDQ